MSRTYCDHIDGKNELLFPNNFQMKFLILDCARSECALSTINKNLLQLWFNFFSLQGASVCDVQRSDFVQSVAS